MAVAKRKPRGPTPRGTKQNRKGQITVATALKLDASATTSKAAARRRYKEPSSVLAMLARELVKLKPLLQYRQAFAGRSVSLRVDVAPDGEATVTPVEQKTIAAGLFPLEEVSERDPALQKALDAARERGRTRAAEELARSDMVSAEAFAKLLGTTRVTVNAKRQNGQLLGLDGARRGFRFPVWQIGADGKPYPELPTLLEHLGTPWGVYRFLVQAHGSLRGLTGREALERGKGANAIAAAEGIARGDFT